MTDNNHTDDHFRDKPTPDNQAAGKPPAGDHSPQTVHRPWRQIAEAVLQEKDHDKILELTQELCDAVDEQVLQQGRKPGER